MADNTTPHWYVVHTYSGYENKVKASLDMAVVNNKMQDVIFEVRIPVEEAVEIKNNKRRVVQHKVLPGYVFVRMIMTNYAWFLVRNTRGVTGFVGPGSKPEPLSEEELEKLCQTHEVFVTDIEVGDEVRMLTGMFAGSTGIVHAIDKESNKVSVGVTMLQKETVIDLDYDEVAKLDE